MKWLSILLPLYMLVLSLVPCSDPIVSAQEEMYVTSSHEAHSHEKSHDHSQDNCTPFCTCSCCGIALTAADFHFFRVAGPPAAHAPATVPETAYPLVSNYLENIWQPPQA